MFSVHYRDDPRAGDLRAAVVQEGFDTVCIAPLLDGDEPEPLGILGVYHDEPHPWTEDELETMAALATQATVAIKAAAELRPARDLGRPAPVDPAARRAPQPADAASRRSATRSRPSSASSSTTTTCASTGWTAQDLDPGGHAGPGRRVPRRDARAAEGPVRRRASPAGWPSTGSPSSSTTPPTDPRAQTIPGTEDDLDESMLLAPMLFEDEVLGVLVLSKLGLRQFRDDDLRLLEIYASFAAQAMANADATERLREQSAALEQKVRGQRELLEITESILTTLDPPVLLGTIADRLGELIGSDNVAIELVDQSAGRLRRSSPAASTPSTTCEPWEPGEEGLATWVLEHNEPVCVVDEFDDPRVLQPRDRARPRQHRVRPAARPRRRDRRADARAHRRGPACSPTTSSSWSSCSPPRRRSPSRTPRSTSPSRQRAQTDVLTGLLNHGTFAPAARRRSIDAGEPFSLVMLDLDRFKPVNDGMGHQAGDLLLRQVADAIVAASRDSDRVFRYGGDEFAVLLPRTDGEHVGPIAERVRAAVEGRRRARLRPGAAARAPSRRRPARRRSRSTARAPRRSSWPPTAPCSSPSARGGGRVASAAEGVALAGEFTLQTPTPIDPARRAPA